MTTPFGAAADLLDPPAEPLREEAEAVGADLRTFVRAAWPVLEPGNRYLHNWHIDLICEWLEAVYAREVTRLIINIPPRYMKPLDDSTLVLRGDGRRVPLREIQVDDEVVTHLGRPRRVLEVAEQGQLGILLITTESGRMVRTAHDHPFLTPAGWVKAADLRVGDALGAVVPQNRPASQRTFEEFRMAGYFIGDGCTVWTNTSCQAVINCFDPDQGDDVHFCAEALEWGVHHVPSRGRYSFSKGVRPWLREVGLAGGTSWTKRVPDFVFAGSNRQVGEFLGAYFACDGTLNARSGRSGEKKRSDLTVTFNSVNRPLLEDMQHLLLRLGVRSRIRPHRGGGYKGEGYMSWRLTITSFDDTAKFVERVPVIGQKARRLAEWATQRARFDVHLEPDRIVSITDDGTASCRCLRVEGDESFTANDLAVHNSSLVTIIGPVWDWVHRPQDRFMFASYDQSLSTKHSVDRRTLIRSQWFQDRFGDRFRLSGDQDVKTEFSNNRRGHMIATSIRGSATGKGGDHIVIDDPLNPKQAPSDKQREETNRLFDQTFSQRLDDKERGTITVVMQRLHEKDLTGHLLEKGGWEHVKLPNPDLRGSVVSFPRSGRKVERPPGDILWPERESPKAVDHAKTSLGSQAFAGQYGQDPSPAEGGIFKRKWWGFWKPAAFELPPVTIQLPEEVVVARLVDLPSVPEKLQSWDCAFKDTKASDYVVGQVWGARGARRFLLDQVRDRMSFSRTLKEIPKLSELHPDAYAKLIEDKANGPAVIDTLKDEVVGILPVEPQGGKEARAHAVSPQVEGGQVFLPHPAIAPWVWDFIEEAAVFPNGAHDDQVDAMTQALLRLMHHGQPAKMSSAANRRMRGL